MMLHSVNGAGRVNKYFDISLTRSLVQYNHVKGTKERNGRPLFENQSNPYQFDRTNANRLDNVRTQVAEKYESSISISPSPQARGSSPAALSRKGSLRSRGSRGASEYCRIEVGAAGAPRTPSPAPFAVEGNVLNASLGLNTVQAVPTSLPGYMGFVPGSYAENIHECGFGKVSVVAAQTRSGSGQRSFNSVQGRILPPMPWSTGDSA